MGNSQKKAHRRLMEEEEKSTHPIPSWNAHASQPDFLSPQIERSPFHIHSNINWTNKIKTVYCTTYNAALPDSSGIFCCDLWNNETHKTIKLWHHVEDYQPLGCSYIYNETEKEIIFVGGHDGSVYYECVAVYNLELNTLKKIDLGMSIGTSPRLQLIFTNDLHIIGGAESDHHIIFNLSTNVINKFHSFKQETCDMQQVMNAGFLYSKLTNTMVFFGGYSWKTKTFCNNLWMLNLNASPYLVNGYIADKYKSAKWEFSLNRIVLKYIGKYTHSQWQINKRKRMMKNLESFGYVLYDYRIIVTFGGQQQKYKCIDNIYYTDLVNDDGPWIESKLKCPLPGACNALLVDQTVHILPYWTYNQHYSINIAHILPSALL